MKKATAHIGKEHYRTDITVSEHKIIADEPKDEGGTDNGPAPTALLASALAACTAITLRMYADRKQWDLSDIDVNVTFERDNRENRSFMSRTIEVKGNLDEAQRKRLLDIANLCPVHKTLTHPIEIDTTLT